MAAAINKKLKQMKIIGFNVLTKSVLSLLLTSLFMKTYSQPSLVGKWRRTNPNVTYQDTTYKKLIQGDIEIRSDTTFHIEGDSATQNSVITGWHTGDEYNGTWELHNSNRLTFWMAPKETKMLLTYLIIKLTKETLVLRIPSYSKDDRSDITYLRL